MEENDTEISSNSIEKMKKTPLIKVIIVSKNNQEKLNLVKKEFIELKMWKFASNKEFVFKTLLQDKSQLVIIKQKISSHEKLFESIK